MKFINYLESITGISIFPLTSMVIFITFFALVAWYVFTTPKKMMQEKCRLPID